MITKQYPSREHLLELFTYDANTGYLFWKKGIGKAKLGKLAGTSRIIHQSCIGVDRESYSAKDLIWIMHYGDIPEGCEVIHQHPRFYLNRLDNLLLVNIETREIVQQGSDSDSINTHNQDNLSTIKELEGMKKSSSDNSDQRDLLTTEHEWLDSTGKVSRQIDLLEESQSPVSKMTWGEKFRLLDETETKQNLENFLDEEIGEDSQPTDPFPSEIKEQAHYIVYLYKLLGDSITHLRSRVHLQAYSLEEAISMTKENNPGWEITYIFQQLQYYEQENTIE